MTEEEKMADHKAWQKAMAEGLQDLLSEEGPGILALRIFYAVRHKDDTVSMGQLGATPEKNVEIGADLIRRILAILMDPDQNHSVTKAEVGGKH